VPAMLHSSAVFICVFVGAHIFISVRLYLFICIYVLVYVCVCVCVCVFLLQCIGEIKWI